MAQFNWNLRGTIPGPRWCSFGCCFTLGEIRYPSNSQICFLHFHAMLKAKVITQQRPDPAHHKDIWPVWSLIWEVEAFPSIFWTPKGGMVEPPTWAHWAVALQAVMPFPRAIWGGGGHFNQTELCAATSRGSLEMTLPNIQPLIWKDIQYLYWGVLGSLHLIEVEMNKFSLQSKKGWRGKIFDNLLFPIQAISETTDYEYCANKYLCIIS